MSTFIHIGIPARVHRPQAENPESSNPGQQTLGAIALLRRFEGKLPSIVAAGTGHEFRNKVIAPYGAYPVSKWYLNCAHSLDQGNSHTSNPWRNSFGLGLMGVLLGGL